LYDQKRHTLRRSYRQGAGDVNGFLGLVVDNLSVLGLLAAVLITGRPVEAEDGVHAAVNAGEATVAGARAEGELVGETA